MKLLAIDTATEACSAALLREGEIREHFEIAPRQHADLILKRVEELLDAAGLRLRELDAIAFGRGPGAFTGVRIGVGVVQGLAFGAELPVVPVSDLQALAQQAYDSHHRTRVLAAIDARMGEVYWGAFELGAEGVMEPAGEECVIAPEHVPLPQGEGWFGIGTGWGAHSDALKHRLGEAVEGWDGEALPRAREVAVLGAALLKAGTAVPPEQALPTYLRDNVAKKSAERG